MTTFNTTPSYMSLQLSSFFGLPWNAMMTPENARERVRQYIVNNNLISKSDPNEVIVDKALCLFVHKGHIKNQQVSLSFLLERLVTAQFGCRWEIYELTFLLYCLIHHELSHMIYN